MSARLRLLLLAGLLLALAVTGSLAWTRSIALPALDRAEMTLHQREQARLWAALVEQQQRLLALAAEELGTAGWLSGGLAAGSGELLATRLGLELPELRRRYGVDAVEIHDQRGALLRLGGDDSRGAFVPDDPLERHERQLTEPLSGFRQDRSRAFVLSYAQPLPSGGSIVLAAEMERLLAGIARNGVAPARPAAFADLRGQAVALAGPEEGRALLRAVAAGEAAVPAGLRLLETPLSDLAGRPIGQLLSLLPAEPVEAEARRLDSLGPLLALGLFLLLLLVLARALQAEFAPLDRLIRGVAALARGESEVEVPRHLGDDEAGRLSAALQLLRQRALLLVTLEISRERQRRRQERFLRRQLLGLAETLEGRDREALLGDLERLEQAARRAEGESGAQSGQAGESAAAADGRLERTLLESRGGQDDFALLAVAFENLSFRIRDQNASLKQLVAELNEALRAKSEFLLLQQELDLARKMQLSILPPDRPERAGLAVHGSMLPAKEVGGDFYDFFELDDGRLAMVVADVSGKGVPAAFFSLITRTLLKAIVTTGAEPAPAITRLNDLLAAENEQMMFVTLFFGLLAPDSGRFRYVNAGHNPPMLLRNGGEVEMLAVTGDMALAVLDEQDYQERELTLAPGELLLLYTDGVTEACDPDNREFGEERLLTVLRENQETPTWMLPQAVGNAVKLFENGAPQADDLTVLALGYRRATPADSAGPG